MTLLKTLAESSAQTRSTAPASASASHGSRPGDPNRQSSRAAAANDSYGLFSIENFPPDISDLSETHNDALGFYDYVSQFTAPNFWYQDENVLAWAYGEQYDNWQDFYGFDACMAEYHSGHGTMDANGTFSAPMGGTWGGASWVYSSGMRLGNEMARYIFWSTCLSLRVLDGHDPIRTWQNANGGWRMLFGFETESIDDPNYGKFFFEEWNKSKSFSQAWLDGSWRISSHQAPSVVACGATQQEAQNRLHQERHFDRAAASTSWWAWRWYNAARSVPRAVPQLPETHLGALLTPLTSAALDLGHLGERFGLSIPAGVERQGSAERGVSHLDDSGWSASIGRDGTREVRLADIDMAAPQLAPEEAVRVAESAVHAFELSSDVDLIQDQIRYDYRAAGTADERVAPRVHSTVVHFRQVVNGLPVVTPGSGEVQIHVDNTGTVVEIVDSTRQVSGMRERPRAPQRTPELGQAPASATAPPEPTSAASSLDELLDAALRRRVRSVADSGHSAARGVEVPGSTEVGYALRGSEAVVVARREVELDMGHGLAKRYVLEVPVPE